MKSIRKKACTGLVWMAAALLLAPAITSADNMWADAQFGGDGHWREVDRIEGTWDVTVNITLCDSAGLPTDTPVPGISPMSALAMFAANGTFHDTNAANPATRSVGLGTWRRTGNRTYEFAFKFFRFNPAIGVIGPQIVRHTVVLARDGRSYTSRGTAEFFDAANNPAPVKGCSTSTATRFR
jgi:hypothetical protein